MYKTKNKIVSSMIWSFFERIAAQLVSIVVAIILARLLTPSEYGTVSLVTIFITIANVFIIDGFGSALIQKDKADDKDFSTVFYFGIVFSIAMYIIIYFIAVWIADFYNMAILIPVLRVLALKIPIAAINSVQHAYVSRKMLFKRFFYATLIGTIISAFVGIVMAYKGFGVWALVAQDLTNTIIDTIVLWVTVKWRPIKAFSFFRLKLLFSYGWKLLVQSLLNTLYGNIRSLVIGKIYTSQDLAYYTKASRYPNLIAANVDTAMGKTLFPVMSKEQQDLSRIKAIARRSIKLCSYVMSPLLIGLAVSSEAFVSLLLTDKWIPIVPYMRIICFCLLFRAAQTSALQAIKSTGKSDVVLKMDIPVRIFGIVALVIAIRFGVIYVAISEVIVEFFCLILYGVYCQKTIGYKLVDIFTDFGVNVFQASLMGIFVWLVDYFTNFSSFITLGLQVVVGGISFILITKTLGNENYIYIISEVKKYLKINIRSKRVTSFSSNITRDF